VRRPGGQHPWSARHRRQGRGATPGRIRLAGKPVGTRPGSPTEGLPRESAQPSRPDSAQQESDDHRVRCAAGSER